LKEYTSSSNFIITVTSVKVSSDLKLAKIYLSIFSNKDQNICEEIFKNILKTKSQLRFLLGNSLNSKYVPQIKLFKDDNNSIYDKLIKISK